MSHHPMLATFDGHNDVLTRLSPFARDEIRRFLDGRLPGHLDVTRARAGGLAGGFFAIFLPPTGGWDVRITDTGYEVPLAPPLDPIVALRGTLAAVAGLFRIESESGGRVKLARTVADLARCRRDGVLAAILHFEGAEAIDPGLDALEVFYRAGLRSLGIVWSRPNAFGHGVPFRFPASPDTGPGLTGAGRELVRACNRLGILVDVSHLNEQGFWDVARITQAPLVATHSAAHAICPSTRNLTDHQLAAIRDSDGIVGVNFEVSSIRPDGFDEPDTPLTVLVAQIDYLVARLGIERVAFGSDFDGATMPRELADVAGLPRLIAALRERGYDTAALEQLTYGNWARVLGATWRA